jgi:multisubunit Na+/H+ antiporter MnhB subunit
MNGMSPIVQTVARFVKVFILLYGIYLTFTGHLTPGGGFAGGVVIASLYILLTLAYGKKFSLKYFPKRLAGSLDSAGALIFLLVAVLGFYFGGIFFINFLEKMNPSDQIWLAGMGMYWLNKPFKLLSAGTIPINNIAICIKVASSLFLVFIIMAVARIIDKKDGSKDYKQDEEEE